MRFLLAALAISLLVAGCGTPVRTVLVAPPAAPTVRGELKATATKGEAETYVVAPVYQAPRAVVFAACVRACDSYCHDRPTDVDAAAGALRVLDGNAWTGSMYMTVAVSDLGDGRARLEMTAEPRGGVNDSFARKRMRGFIEHVDRQMAAVRDLRALAGD